MTDSNRLQVKVIGAGGIGSWAAHFVVAEAYVKHPGTRIVIVDGDSFAPRNALRQALFYGVEDGPIKAENAWYELNRKYGSRLVIDWEDRFISRENVYSIIADGDIVLLCVDNHETRHLVSVRCQDMDNCELISGGNEGTVGHIILHRRKDGVDLTPPIHRHHPDIALASLHLPERGFGCGGVVDLDEQILATNIAVAHEMFQAFRLIVEQKLDGREIWLDIANGTKRVVQ